MFLKVPSCIGCSKIIAGKSVVRFGVRRLLVEILAPMFLRVWFSLRRTGVEGFAESWTARF